MSTTYVDLDARATVGLAIPGEQFGETEVVDYAIVLDGDDCVGIHGTAKDLVAFAAFVLAAAVEAMAEEERRGN